MYPGIRQLCALSLICGAAMSMTPEGGVKRVAELVCMASLVLAVLSPVRELDFETYAMETARLHEMEAALTQEAHQAEQRLNRLVIEQEYETYILDKAEELGIENVQAEIQVQWSLEGFWTPYAVIFKSSCTQEEKERLSRSIEQSLGIPYERQQWYADEQH